MKTPSTFKKLCVAGAAAGALCLAGCGSHDSSPGQYDQPEARGSQGSWFARRGTPPEHVQQAPSRMTPEGSTSALGDARNDTPGSTGVGVGGTGGSGAAGMSADGGMASDAGMMPRR